MSVEYRCTAYRADGKLPEAEVFSGGHGLSQVLNFMHGLLQDLWEGNVHTITIERIDNGTEGDKGV